MSADLRAAEGLLREIRCLEAPTPPMLYSTHRLRGCRRVSRRLVFLSKTRPVIIPQYEHGKLAIDVINGGPLLREWVKDAAATPQDLDALAMPDEQAWLNERREYLRY